MAEAAYKIGDLDVAEICYDRAIDDAKYLGRPQDEMACLFEKTTNVYIRWGRNEESLSNFRTLLEHSDNVNGRGTILNNIAMILDRKGEYDSWEIGEIHDDERRLLKSNQLSMC